VSAAIEWIAATPRRAFLVVFVAAFSLRLGLVALGLIPDAWHPPGRSLEPEAVAASLVRTGQFADPYAVPTGPTAHVPPLHALGLATILAVFGETPAAGLARLLLIFAAYATLYALLPWLAGRVGLGRPAGVLAGLAGALLLTWPEEVEPFAALALALLVAAFHRRWTAGPPTPWASFLLGVASGVAFHLQPVLLAVVAGLLAYELWGPARRRRWRAAAVVVLGIFVACVPWAWRNHRAFGEVVFVRDNLGLELRAGNREGASAEMAANHRLGTDRHPRTSAAEALRVRALGERAYMHEAGREAVDWIRRHPTRFIELTGLRAVHFWFGPSDDLPAALVASVLTGLAALGALLALPRLPAPSRASLLVPLATFPLIYYLLAYAPRYRVPLDWLLLLLAGAAVGRGLEHAARPRAAGPDPTAGVG
jgi:hypothetical protein